MWVSIFVFGTEAVERILDELHKCPAHLVRANIYTRLET